MATQSQEEEKNHKLDLNDFIFNFLEMYFISLMHISNLF